MQSPVVHKACWQLCVLDLEHVKTWLQWIFSDPRLNIDGFQFSHFSIFSFSVLNHDPKSELQAHLLYTPTAQNYRQAQLESSEPTSRI